MLIIVSYPYILFPCSLGFTVPSIIKTLISFRFVNLLKYILIKFISINEAIAKFKQLKNL